MRHLRDFKSFTELRDTYLDVINLIRTPEDLARICREVVEDDAAEGVGYTEPAIGPHFYADRFRTPVAEIFGLMRAALFEAGDRAGVSVGLMLGVDRGFPIAETEAVAAFAAEHASEGVVAFGIGLLAIPLTSRVLSPLWRQVKSRIRQIWRRQRT